MEVTIVGAGSYGSLIASKYTQSGCANVKAVVSPRPNNFTARHEYCAGATQWKGKFGVPTSDDVFDFCIHPQNIPKVLGQFVGIGGKNFILPKPVALSANDLTRLKQMVIRHRLRVLVASQWYYSSLGVELKKIFSQLPPGVRVVMDFSQDFPGLRGERYTPFSALLPHMLQIVDVAGISTREFSLQKSSPRYVCVCRAGDERGPEIILNSRIDSPARSRTIEVYVPEHDEPVLSGYLGGFSKSDPVGTPFISFEGRIYKEKGDILEEMIRREAMAFDNCSSVWDKDALSLNKYFPLAETYVALADEDRNSVAVIGGGVFGLLSGIEIARRGHPVVLFEKRADVFMGASYVNQCRVHMGYHYPRDEQTARATLSAQKEFRETFPDAIVEDGFENYYCFAREGSMVTKAQCRSFCRSLGLPYHEEFPSNVVVSSTDVDFSLKVPEVIFDADKVKKRLLEMVDEVKNMEIVTGAEVVGVARVAGGYSVEFTKSGRRYAQLFSGVVNATYSDLNRINQMLGLPLPNYQYELCEMLAVKVPWEGKTGVAIMDGPFCGIMPFGFKNEYLLYDVELSILERSMGTFPDFRFDVPYYDQEERRMERFRKVIDKMKRWFPQLERAASMYSLYATRIVFPKKEATDARPTLLENPIPGIWWVFSGKITTAVPIAKSLAEQVDAFVRTLHKVDIPSYANH